MKELLSLMKQTRTKTLVWDKYCLCDNGSMYLVVKDSDKNTQCLFNINKLSQKAITYLYYKLPHKNNIEMALSRLIKSYHKSYSLDDLNAIKEFLDYVKNDKKDGKRYKGYLIDLDKFYENLVDERNEKILSKLENERQSYDR